MGGGEPCAASANAHGKSAAKRRVVVNRVQPAIFRTGNPRSAASGPGRFLMISRFALNLPCQAVTNNPAAVLLVAQRQGF